LDFIASVVHANEVDAAGDDSSFEEAEEDPTCYQALDIIDEAHADRRDAWKVSLTLFKNGFK